MSNFDDVLEPLVRALSHDLRQPLIAAGGFAAIAESALNGGDLEEGIALIHRLQSALERTELRLSHLVRFARMGERRHGARQVELDGLFMRVLAQIRRRYPDKIIQQRLVGALPVIWADPLNLEGVFEHLLENAVHFARDVGAIEVEIGHHIHPDYPISLYFKDNGIGISPIYQKSIFEPFQKINGDGGGAGMGLAYCRRLLSLEGGAIWLEAERSADGACFVLGLPALRAPDEAV